MDKNEVLVLLAVLVVGAAGVFSLIHDAGITGLPVSVVDTAPSGIVEPSGVQPLQPAVLPSLQDITAFCNAQLQVGPHANPTAPLAQALPQQSASYTGFKAPCFSWSSLGSGDVVGPINNFCSKVTTNPTPTVGQTTDACQLFTYESQAWKPTPTITLPTEPSPLGALPPPGLTVVPEAPTILETPPRSPEACPQDVPGDTNDDGLLDLSDGVHLFKLLFLGDSWKPVPCGDACKKVVGACEASALRKFSSCLGSSAGQSEKCIKLCVSGQALGGCINACDVAFDQNIKSCAEKSGFNDCVAKQQACLASC